MLKLRRMDFAQDNSIPVITAQHQDRSDWATTNTAARDNETDLEKGLQL